MSRVAGVGDTEAMGGRFDVFLSYNSADRPLVERIAQGLEEQRLQPWWDRWALTPGTPWQQELVQGLRSSRACAVFVGEAGLGDWAREELAVAYDMAAKDRSFRIFMVLLPGAPELSDPSLAFLRTRSCVDLRGGVDRDGLTDLVAAVVGAPRRREVAVADTDTCPYRGLEAFEEQHAEFFFGREDDVALVVEKLKASRFLAVLGPSGSGKSSLLRAGVMPVLRGGALRRSEGWSLRVFTPGARPLSALAVQLTRLFPGAPVQQTLDRLADDERSLDLAVSVALGDRPVGERLLLVVDQFEELFTLCRHEQERCAFLANLVYAATIPGGRVVVVVGMRADFYHRCAPYPGLRALVADQQFLVGPLDAEGLRRVIEEPARRVGLELEAGLTETITADVEARPGSLPLLEHVLLEVWRRRRGTMLTLEAYVASGGVEGALAQRANVAYASLSPPEQEIARRVLLRLIQPGEGAEDTRRRAPMTELVRRPGQKEDVEVVVQALADQRLVTTGHDEVSGAAIVDITHEALIRGWPELRAWINEDREALRAQRRLTEAATEWDRRGRQDDDLYTGSRLGYWKERATTGLSELERAFVAAGVEREARERAAGRRRTRLAVGGVGLALATVAIVALVGLENVADQRDIARSRQLAAEATASLPTDPATAVRLAADAYELTPTEEAERALKQALSTPGSRVELLVGHDGAVEEAAFSRDGTRVLSAGQDGTVRIWDWTQGAEVAVLQGHQSGVNSTAFSSDGTRVVSAGDDGTVRVWDWARGAELSVLRDGQRWVWTAAFSPDGTRVVSAGEDGTVRVWDWAVGAAVNALQGHDGSVTSAAFSPDGSRVISAGADGTVRIWDWAAGRELAVLDGHEQWVSSAAFSPDGERVVSAGADGTVRVTEWRAGRELAVLGDHAGQVASAAFSPDGDRVVSAGDDKTIRVWEWGTATEVRVLQGHEQFVISVAFSPDGDRVVSAGDDKTVRVWDWATGRELHVLEGHDGSVQSVAFSPDGDRVVSAGDDKTVRVWDWATGRELHLLEGHRDWVSSAAFSHDGSRVVSASADGTVRVWDCTACHSLDRLVALARSGLLS
jgi:WD40 repeat protein/ABC-type Fe3+/spermidine/putrescine transport system ATPase subunit